MLSAPGVQTDSDGEFTDLSRQTFLSHPTRLRDTVDHYGMDDLLRDRAAALFLSYYQKALTSENQQRLDAHFRGLAVEDISALTDFPPLRGFNENEMRRVFGSLASIQLTIGCNAGIVNKCIDWCAFDAAFGVRQKIPFKVLEKIVQLAPGLQGWCAFFASDISDYKDGQYDMRDVHKLVAGKYGSDSHYRTAFAPGTAKRLEGLPIAISHYKNPHTYEQLVSQRPEAHVLRLDEGGNKDAIRIQQHGVNAGEHPDYNDPISISCSSGVLLTPRAVYSIVMHIGNELAAPQRQFVVPFLKLSPQLPAVGNDVRLVLSGHVPLLTKNVPKFGREFMNRFLLQHYDYLENRVPNVFFINHPVGAPTYSSKVYAIVYEGCQVTQVTPVEECILSAGSPLLEHVKQAAAHYFMLGGTQLPDDIRPFFSDRCVSSIAWTILQADLIQERVTGARR